MSTERKPKIGEGSIKAAGRKGVKELAAAAVPAFPTTSPLIDEPGDIFSPPQAAISQQTGHTQPISVVDRHRQEMANTLQQDQQPTIHGPTQTETKSPTISPSIVQQHAGEMQQAPTQAPEQEIEK